ncbi:MAG: serine hydrolase, partial [Bacteroidia bacterium]|nr:serine hydrolase [Bacteroidia bacterium]
PLPVVLKEKVMDPIGASSTWRWYGYDNSFVNMDGLMVQSVSGGGHFGGVGDVYQQPGPGPLWAAVLRKGRWKNQQLISEAWVQAPGNPQPPTLPTA